MQNLVRLFAGCQARNRRERDEFLNTLYPHGGWSMVTQSEVGDDRLVFASANLTVNVGDPNNLWQDSRVGQAVARTHPEARERAEVDAFRRFGAFCGYESEEPEEGAAVARTATVLVVDDGPAEEYPIDPEPEPVREEPEASLRGAIKEYRRRYPQVDVLRIVTSYGAQRDFPDNYDWTRDQFGEAEQHLHIEMRAYARKSEPVDDATFASWSEPFAERLIEAEGMAREVFGKALRECSACDLEDLARYLEVWKDETPPTFGKAVWGWLYGWQDRTRIDLKGAMYPMIQEAKVCGTPLSAESAEWTPAQCLFLVGRIRGMLYAKHGYAPYAGDPADYPDDPAALRNLLTMKLENLLTLQGKYAVQGNKKTFRKEAILEELRAIHELDPGRYPAIYSLANCKDVGQLKAYCEAADGRIATIGV